MTLTVTLEEAKRDIDILLDRVINEAVEIVITETGRPIAKIIPITQRAEEPREPGADKGKILVRDDFNDPLPEDALGGTY